MAHLRGTEGTMRCADVNSSPRLRTSCSTVSCLLFFCFLFCFSTLHAGSLTDIEVAFGEEMEMRGWIDLADDQYTRLLTGRSLLKGSIDHEKAPVVRLSLARLLISEIEDPRSVRVISEGDVVLMRRAVRQFDQAVDGLRTAESMPEGETFADLVFEVNEVRVRLAEMTGRAAMDAVDEGEHTSFLIEAEALFNGAIDDYKSVAARTRESLADLDEMTVGIEGDERGRLRGTLESVVAKAEFEALRSRYLLAKIYRKGEPAEKMQQERVLTDTIREARAFGESWIKAKVYGDLYEGLALSDLGRFEQASEALSGSIEKRVDDPRAVRLQQAAMYWAAVANIELKRYEDAVGICRRFADWFPASVGETNGLEMSLLNGRAHAEWGFVERNEGKLKTQWQPLLRTAFDILEPLSSKSSPVRDRSRHYRAVWVKMIGQPVDFDQTRIAATQTFAASGSEELSESEQRALRKEALRLFREAFCLTPDLDVEAKKASLAEAWFDVARVYFLLGRRQEASIACAQAGRLTSPGEEQARLFGYRVRILEELHEITGSAFDDSIREKAVKDRAVALSDARKSITDTQFRKALVAEERGLYSEAIVLYEGVKPESDRYAQALHNVGRCHIRYAHRLIREKAGSLVAVEFTVGENGPIPPAALFVTVPEGEKLAQEVRYRGTVYSGSGFAWWAMRSGTAVIVRSPEKLAREMGEFEKNARLAARKLEGFLDWSEEEERRDEIERSRLKSLRASAISLLGSVYIEPPFGDAAKVRQMLAGYEKRFPREVALIAQTILLRLRANVKLGLPEEIQKDIDQLVRHRPSNDQISSAYKLAASCLSQISEEERLAGKKETAEQYAGEATELFQKLILTDPDQSFEIYYNLFRRSYVNGDYEAAVRLGKTVIERFGDDPQSKEQVDSMRELLGVSFAETGKFDEAIALLQGRKELYDDITEDDEEQRAKAWLVTKTLAHAYAGRRELKTAAELYVQARRGLSPERHEHWEVHLSLCQVYIDMKEFDKAWALASSLYVKLPAAPLEDAVAYLDMLSRLQVVIPNHCRKDLIELTKGAKEIVEGVHGTAVTAGGVK